MSPAYPTIQDRYDLIARLYPLRASWTKVILDIDDEKCIPFLKVRRVH